VDDKLPTQGRSQHHVTYLSRVVMPMYAERDTVMANPSVRRSVILVMYRN